MTTIMGNLYYRPATRVRGDAILPLNALRQHHPDLYDLHRAKYENTPGWLTQPIEPLGCTWSDVVFLSPVHPAPLFEAIRRSGRAVPDREPWVLPAARLDPRSTVIRLMRAGTTGHTPDLPNEDDYLPFTTATLRAVNRVTINAIQRLETLRPDDPWLPWVDVPHVLHHGPIPLPWFTSAPL